MVDPVPISRTGYSRLKEELDRLQKEELPRVMRAVAEARELGDLRENGEYLAGREQQGFVVGRIRELNGMLSRSDIIDCTKVEPDGAVFGTVVSLLDLDTNQKATSQLLGPDEADSGTGSVSIHSPIGRAILGHSVGDKVSVETPRGDRHFEVVGITRSNMVRQTRGSPPGREQPGCAPKRPSTTRGGCGRS
jgi:transcription elongation factor GreA